MWMIELAVVVLWRMTGSNRVQFMYVACVCDRFELELEHERKRERHVLWYRSSVSRRS